MTHTILLIAGQPKAGTTSLFSWLSKHPDVSVGYLKELRFFLDNEYPLNSPKRFNGENFEEFFELFEHPLKNVLLDVSPDYFGCNTPLKIPSLYRDTKAVIVIREPVARMKSAYRFFRARGRIQKSMTFDDYIFKQHSECVTENTPVQFRALDHCRTNHYLSKWREVYGEDLLVLDFDDLRDGPGAELSKIYRFVGLDEPKDVLKGSYETANRTTAVKSTSLYRLFTYSRRLASTKLIKFTRIRAALSPISKMINRQLIADGELETIEPSSLALKIIREKSGE